ISTFETLPYEVSGLALGEPFFGHHLSESGCALDAQVPKVRQVFVRVLESRFDQTRSPFSYLLGENGHVFLAQWRSIAATKHFALRRHKKHELPIDLLQESHKVFRDRACPGPCRHC